MKAKIRKIKKENSDTYICSNCKGKFKKGRSDEEAMKEYRDNFPGHSENEVAIICDDCYKKYF